MKGGSRHIIPLIGNLNARDLARAESNAWPMPLPRTFKTKPRGKAVVEGGGSAAARTVELLGGIWSWADKRGLVTGPSPTRGVETQGGTKGPHARC
jgi:hypothetical protein